MGIAVRGLWAEMMNFEEDLFFFTFSGDAFPLTHLLSSGWLIRRIFACFF